MLPAVDAEALILELVAPLDPEQDGESVALSQALGQILAADVISPLDFPHWDNSAMDGYAVRFADVQGATAETPVMLTVVEEIPAGNIPQVTLQAGQAARILTGSMVPHGADTIVIQEETERDGEQVKVLSEPTPQAFVRHQASYHPAGAPLLKRGTCLYGPEIAVLAAAQCAQVRVYRPLKVAILSTGDELVGLEQPLQPGQIVDSNQYALAALVRQAGAIPLCLGIVPDDPVVLKAQITAAVAQADVVLSSGGVSVGDYDYVDRILSDLGATLHVRSVAVKPGKPLTVATLPSPANPVSVLYFGLPGNPVSALVSFWRFVEPALRKRSGLSQGWSPLFMPARSRHDLNAGGKRETYLWGQLQLSATGAEFAIAGGGHSSGNLINLGTTNALAVVPMGTRHIPAGERVQVMIVGRPLSRQ